MCACAFVYVRQLQALCVLGCNQQHFLCGRLCSLIGVLANNRGREKERVSSAASCVAACMASELEKPRSGLERRSELWHFYTSATSDSLSNINLSSPLPLCVFPCLCEFKLLRLRSHVGCSQLCSLASMLAGTGDSPGVSRRSGFHVHSHRDKCTPTHMCTVLFLSLALYLCLCSCRFCFCRQQMG